MKINPGHTFTVLFLGILLLGIFSFKKFEEGRWGFYAHRLINRMAVFTLPPEMLKVFKPNIQYLEVHAVDPDKRRYATVFEAVRHYIDLDHWGVAPYPDMPRRKSEAFIRHTDISIIASDSNNRILIDGEKIWQALAENKKYTSEFFDGVWEVGKSEYYDFFGEKIMSNYYEEVWQVDCDDFLQFYSGPEISCTEIQIIDSLSLHGILPFHLVDMQHRLTDAFVSEDVEKILRLSADMGHYIGDAHVPLHTTKNYNGQLTNQLGIHAFWESRIPELFAEEEYDFFVGKATYISDPVEHYWKIVLESNSYVDSVLLIEKALSEEFGSDRKYCFDERLNQTIRTECEEYARAYQTRLAGQVEDRMRKAIHAIGSAWYTAWIDAGQPDFEIDEWQLHDTLFLEETAKSQGVGKRFTKRAHE